MKRILLRDGMTPSRVVDGINSLAMRWRVNGVVTRDMLTPYVGDFAIEQQTVMGVTLEVPRNPGAEFLMMVKLGYMKQWESSRYKYLGMVTNDHTGERYNNVLTASMAEAVSNAGVPDGFTLWNEQSRKGLGRLYNLMENYALAECEDCFYAFEQVAPHFHQAVKRQVIKKQQQLDKGQRRYR